MSKSKFNRDKIKKESGLPLKQPPFYPGKMLEENPPPPKIKQILKQKSN